MLRFIYWTYIILFLYIPVFSAGALGNDKTVDASSVIQTKDNLLTVKVKDMSLKEVLKEIANQIPMEIVSSLSLEEHIVADFSSLPTVKGLKLLLHDFNYSLVCEPGKLKGREHEIIKVIILSKTGENQHRIVEQMTISTGEPSLGSLFNDLHVEDPDIRKDAVVTLEGLEDAGSIDLLINALLYDEDEDVKISAAYALGSVGTEVAIDSLGKALQDKDSEVRLSAVEALGDIGGVMSIHVLEGALTNEDEDVREMAAEIIRWLKGEE